MSSLEERIAGWRQQMLAAGIKSPVPLEEMECHLQEAIHEQMRLGLSEHAAFEISIQNIGQPKLLKREFAKTERTFMKIIKVAAAVIGALVGMAFIMPAVAQCKHEGAMAGDEVALYTLGMAMCAGSLFLALVALKRRKA
jgi:hypothetical protein